MTTKQAMAIEEMWNAGMTSTLIAKRVGVKKNSVDYYVKTHRDKCPRRKSNDTDSDMDKKAYDMWIETSKPMKEVGEILGVSASTVSRMVLRHLRKLREQGE